MKVTMMKIKIVGTQLRDPKTTKVLEVGSVVEVPESTFWFRRVQDGSVVKVEETAAPAVKAAASEAKPVEKK